MCHYKSESQIQLLFSALLKIKTQVTYKYRTKQLYKRENDI